MSEAEREHWKRVVVELQEVMTIAKIAEALAVDERKVWRWKAGERIPRGLESVRLTAFHMKHCPNRQCRNGHSAIA